VNTQSHRAHEDLNNVPEIEYLARGNTRLQRPQTVSSYERYNVHYSHNSEPQMSCN
jgi:hypothetical protein